LQKLISKLYDEAVIQLRFTDKNKGGISNGVRQNLAKSFSYSCCNYNNHNSMHALK